MKVLFITLLIVASALGRKVNIVRSNDVQACPIDDPFYDQGGGLNVTFHPLLSFDDKGNTYGSLVAFGLSTLVRDININMLLQTITFKVNLKTLDLKSTYEGSGYIDFRPLREVTFQSGNFTGAGPVSITATNVKVQGSANYFVNLIGNKVSIRRLDIVVFNFDEITADLGESFVVGGSPVNWADWSKNFKSNFETDFRDSIKTELVEKARVAVNVYAEKYTLAELIAIIGDDGKPCETP